MVWSILDNAWVTVEYWKWVNGRGAEVIPVDAPTADSELRG